MPTSSLSESSSGAHASPSGPTKPAKDDAQFGFTAETIGNPVIPDLASGDVLRNRYRIDRSLGKGGFGGVYLALDLNLGRKVAIKRQIGRHLDDTELARNEAKFIAGLDHSAIVKVYDLIDDEQEGVLIIMEYVNGYTLHELMKRKRLSIARALELGIEIGQALIHAHSRRIVHRDLKPSNVLLDQTEQVKLSDFGLALGAINADTAPSSAGTPKYMSPEQVRGESHRIDGRSDLWSLGVMLFEMLSGTHPFAGPSRGAIFEAILHDEPTPVRQLNPLVPDAVEHIVHRCLRKRMSERPASASDLVDDLKACLVSISHDTQVDAAGTGRPTAVDSPDSQTPFTSPSSSHQRPLRVEPKGLRPYSEEDGVQYLDLIPGPRERSGLPESIHFWKKWASCDNVDEYASVGVLYGPSGAGKTSFVRAGLINQLDSDICSIVIECRSGDLAGRIEQAILSRFRQKAQAGSLSKLLSNLRKDEGDVFGYRKILIILDQFESWSTTATTEDRRTLAEALRHCDGKTLQSLFVVRDDYWSGITEIMQWIDVPLVENRNVRSLELLDPRHAQRILEGMGRAHGILPRANEPLSTEQQVFIREAIEGLSNNGRVVAVHLVMFAQISRVLPWTPQMLRKQGGVEGACAAYLHQIFETSSGPPAYRRLAGVVADILNELLPAQGDPLKASVKSVEDLRAKLLSAGSGAKCTEALRVLSEDLKLITPTRNEETTDLTLGSAEGYQLAHDFLVEPVRNWVELVRKSTWRGRAVARLAELSELWQRKPQKQFLPSLREYAAMQMVVPSSSRNEKQTKYLRAAGRYHAGRVAATTVATVAAVIFGVLALNQYSKAVDAKRLERLANVRLLVDGPAKDVNKLLDELGRDPQCWPIVSVFLEDKSPQIQVRGGLLALRLGKGSFATIAASLEYAEPELFEVVLLAAEPSDGKKALQDVCASEKSTLRHRMRAAVLLLYLGNDSAVRDLFRPQQVANSTPEQLLDVSLDWRGEPKPWADLIDRSSEADAQATAMLILGSYSTSELDSALDWRKIGSLEKHAKLQVRNMADWQLRYHGKMPLNTAATLPPADADWSVTPQMKIEMRRIEPGVLNRWDFPETHPESYPVRNERLIWAATTVIHRGLFEQFLSEVKNYADGTAIEPLADNGTIPNEVEIHPTRPAVGMRFDAGIEFCNWLSRKEGYTPYYIYEPKNSKPDDAPKRGPQPSKWKLSPSSGGFRFPTETEFQYLALAGAEKGTPWMPLQRLVLKRHQKAGGVSDIDNIRDCRTFPPNRLGLFLMDDKLGYWVAWPTLREASSALHANKVQSSSAWQQGISFADAILVVRDPLPPQTP